MSGSPSTSGESRAAATPAPRSATAGASAPGARVTETHAATMSDLMRQHKQAMEALRRRNEEKYRKVSQSAAAAGTALANATNQDVMEVFNAEHHIETQIKELAQQSETFEKKMNSWSQFFLKFNKELKEVGDLAHWSRCVEQDVQDTIKILDDISSKKRKAMGIGT